MRRRNHERLDHRASFVDMRSIYGRSALSARRNRLAKTPALAKPQPMLASAGKVSSSQ
jgi:hypothetical protein